MFTTTITLENLNTDIYDTEGFEKLYRSVLPEDVITELDYVRTDMILDGKCSNKMYLGFDNITKTHRYVFYHNSSSDMKDMMEVYTVNWAAIKFQHIMLEHGFVMKFLPGGTVSDTRDANKITEINRASLGMVRPERRQEVFDSLEENNG